MTTISPARAERRVLHRRPEVLTERSTHYCPGCGHGIIHRLIGELIDELGVAGRTIGIGSVGCSVFAYDYFAVDFVESPHGRAPAVATGVRRVRPDAFVFTYQGDGDLAAIGTAEIIHAAARGERISVVFVNNGIYGMTGGQMAPTTLLGQRTTSSPAGREAATAGYPLPMTEMLALIPGVSYAARGSIANPQLIGRAKVYLRRAFETQLAGGGLSIVEIVSTCPVGWGMTPTESMVHLERDVVKTYPLGVLVDRLAAGFGGQGLLFGGQVLAQAALLEGREVSWMPSYGPEMRGGTASCTVIISDHPIGSPMVDSADVVVALNPPSLTRFEPLLVANGLLVVNETLVEAAPSRTDIEIASVPASAIATAAGEGRLVSVAALGAVLARRPLVSDASIERALTELVGHKRPELVAANLVALASGRDAAFAVHAA
jgi:pyruvate/2-oxoacid:ferredoxin oxidoreductase beta subunit/Pyruvate/2-oxoacid:ferredoxin oxidoreductase gamma subunit